MKRNHFSFVAGLLIGATLFGGSVAYAAGVIAERSTYPIFVDGQQVNMEAYAINGNTYVKLRDIGKQVGFNVFWQDGVQVDTTTPYTGKAAAVVVTDTAPFIPKEGDTIRCNDGTDYIVTDMSRYDGNMFASGPVGELPAPTCDWSSFPEVELLAPEARHYQYEHGDYLFVRNLYESRRMQYTIQNLAGNHPDTSEGGKLKYGSKGTPTVRIQFGIPEGKRAQIFWPWRTSELERLFNSCPPGTYYMDVWDVYKDGIFQRTEYNIYAI